MATAANTVDKTNRTIGILGGSFDPAHSGHLRISKLALQLLNLEEVWWLVAPQNPLKNASKLEPFAKRVTGAADMAKLESRVKVRGLEAELGTVYTVDTVAALRERWPNNRFAWIMGADNLAEVHLWKRWEQLFFQVPGAVFDRPTYSFTALESPAAQKFAAHRISRRDATSLTQITPPAWVFLWSAFDTTSSTSIRAASDKTA